MAEYLKTAPRTAATDSGDTRATVRAMLDEIHEGRDAAAAALSAKFDGYSGDLLIGPEARAAARAAVPQQLRDDICFARDNVRRFAEAQKASMGEVDLEITPGYHLGQKHIPTGAAGAYVPGGRYAHIASAIMTITTAKVAGVRHVAACSPPRGEEGIPPAILFAMEVCGADSILAMGGVQGVAALAMGLFGLPEADVIVGPGNQYVAEAKRILFGEVGIDMVAGPTDVLILADAAADAELVAVDLVGQAEHGYNSPVWLVTDSRDLAEAVMARVPALIDDLPEVNRDNARAAWRDYAEVVLCADREEMAATSDRYAPEHLQVQAMDLEWWLGRLRAYGSLFLGEEVTVAFGDKASGPNHVLPTSRSARYTGGLSVQKFMKTVTWQRAAADAIGPVAEATARISRLEGMEAHARSADIRLARYGH